MDPIGVVAGSAFLTGGIPADTQVRVVATVHGEVTVHVGRGYVFLRRHGHEGYRPPHAIAHHAHVRALEQLGVRRAVGLCSVGALHATLAAGTAIVPEDYMSLHPPATFAASDERLHIVPALDATLRGTLLAAAAATAGPVHDGGVYAETRGPRFETRAEVRLLADYADVVGMTAATEATLMQERGIAYAMLGLVDNPAHGVGVEALTFEAYEAQLARNQARARAILQALTP
jgi:5'-methylthioadenosine phosphorylase